MPVLQTHLKLRRQQRTGEGFIQGSCRVTGEIGDRTGLEVNIVLTPYDGPVTIGRSGDVEGPEFTWNQTLAGWSSDWTVEIGQGTDAQQEVWIQVDAGRTNDRRPREGWRAGGPLASPDREPRASAEDEL